MKIQFNPQSSISNEHYEHIGKSMFVDNNETRIRGDNKSSKENPLSMKKTSIYDIDIPNARIKDDKNRAHQTSKESPFSVIKTSVKERVILPEKLTVCYNKEKVLQQPTSTHLCNSASTPEVN